MSAPVPPRFARRLLDAALPTDLRDEVVGDLEEIFLRRHRERGSMRARLWYWREALAFTARFLLERIKEWRPGAGAVSVLDLKLGVRRLTKDWGLTLVGGLAMTTAMAMGAVMFSVIDMARTTSLPLDEGDRVVALQAFDATAGERRATPVEDFERWRDRLSSVEDVGAFQTIQRNLSVEDAAPEPVIIAEITAAGFELPRVPPLMGRPILPEDELPGAAPVLVIGYEVWRSRFAARPSVVGRDVRLGRTVHTIVGVMPEGFEFPVSHRYWTALRPHEHAAIGTTDGRGAVFARLAPGETLDRAAAELAAIGLGEASGDGQRSAAARARIVPYAFAFTDGLASSFVMSIVTLLGALLLVPPCANLAILIYARTSARQDEFVARHALGATRGRIVGQLFAETLALAFVSGIAALVVVGVVRGAFVRFLSARPAGIPFWIDARPSVDTVLFVAALAIVASLIAGVLPAIQATRRMRKGGLSASSGPTGPRLGRTWTFLVVAQVAVAVAALPLATEMAWGTLRPGVLGPGFAAEEFLAARLELDPEDRTTPTPADTTETLLAERLGRVQRDLLDRLDADAGFRAATASSSVPGEGPWRSVEVEPRGGVGSDLPTSSLGGSRPVQVTRVAPDFFETLGFELRSGRVFDSRDTTGDQRPAVVSEEFARAMLGNQNPLGRRFRYASDTPPVWHEIVGVVSDLPANEAYGRAYHPVAPRELYPATLTVHTRPGGGDPAVRLREIAASVDPGLRLQGLTRLDAIYREQAFGNMLGALALAAATLSVLLLSAGGMYALMSFTVNQRRHEIGIRAALGAQPSRLLAAVFRRAAWQLGTGALLGGLFATAIDAYIPDDLLRTAGGWNVPGVLPATAALMISVGLLAALGPARRGLEVDPTEAIRGRQ